MTSGDWGRPGRYEDEYGEWQSQSGGEYTTGGHDQHGGYGEDAAYGEPGSYADQPGYGQPGGYGEAGGYGDQAGYGQPGGYYDQAGYDQAGYGEAGGYGDQAGYGEPGGYGDRAGHGEHRAYGSYREQDGYGYPPGYGDDGGQPGSSPYGAAEYPESAWQEYPSGSFDRGRGEPDDSSQWYARSGDYGSGANTGPSRWADHELGQGPPGQALPTGSGRYAEWQDEPAGNWNGREQPADEWDQDDGLLNRRFGPGADDIGRGRRGARARASSRRRRTLRSRVAFVLALLVGAGLLGVGGRYGYEKVRAFITNRYGNYAGPGYGSVNVYVGRGVALTSLAGELLSDGVIMATRPYITAANQAQNANRLQPGIYVLHKHMNAAIAVQWLLDPAHLVKDQVTIPEGLRASDIAIVLAKKTGYPATAFTQIIDHPAQLGLPSWAGGKTAEGFLFPDTYTLTPHETPLQILQAMVGEFKGKIAQIDTQSAAAPLGTTPWHILIAASLVQAEAGSASDFGKISRVIWNRLNQNMHLDFDSAVFYGLHKYGTFASAAELRIDTPYNTYLHGGLPPGPIGNPGLAAVEAALHAPHGRWLYFITDTRHKPYITYFTASFAQFSRWKQQFGG